MIAFFLVSFFKGEGDERSSIFEFGVRWGLYWIRYGDEKLYTSVAANNTLLLKALRGRGGLSCQRDCQTKYEISLTLDISYYSSDSLGGALSNKDPGPLMSRRFLYRI
jgi:hypothetical protein